MENEMAKAVVESPANAVEEELKSSETPKANESDRVLKEAKAYKERAQKAEAEAKSLKAQIELREKEEQQKNGEYKALWEKESLARKADLQKIAKAAVRAKIESIAATKGCVDSEALLQLGKADLLEFDLDTGSVTGADQFIEDIMLRKPYLFATAKTIAVNAATPGGVTAQKKITKLSDIAKPDVDKAWGKALERAQKR